MNNYTFANNSFTGEGSHENGITESTKYIFLSFMVLITLIGIPGNTVVCAVILKLRERSSTDFFILAMSCIDLLSATVNTTFYIIRYEPRIWKVLESDTICRLHLFSIGLTNTCSTMLLAATAFDRLSRTRSNSTTNLPSASIKAKRISAGILILSVAYSIVFPLTTTLDLTTLSCTRLDGYETFATIFDSTLALIYTFMLAVVIVCYTKIVIILRQHHRKTREMKLSTSIRKAHISNSTWPKKSKIQPINNHENIASTSKGISTHTRQIESQGTFQQSQSTQRHGVDTNVSAAARTLKKESTRKFLNNSDSEPEVHNLTVSCKNNIVTFDVSTHRNTTRLNRPQPPYALSSIERDRKLINRTQSKPNILKNPQPPYSVNVLRSIERDRNSLNRTTLMMFLITLIYVSTWIVNWVASIYGTVTDSWTSGLVFLSLKLYMINSITNPVFYIMMSSKFKQEGKTLFCKQ